MKTKICAAAQNLSLFIMDSKGGKVSEIGGGSLQRAISGEHSDRQQHSHRHQRELCQFSWVWRPWVFVKGARGQSPSCFYNFCIIVVSGGCMMCLSGDQRQLKNPFSLPLDGFLSSKSGHWAFTANTFLAKLLCPWPRRYFEEPQRMIFPIFQEKMVNSSSS